MTRSWRAADGSTGRQAGAKVVNEGRITFGDAGLVGLVAPEVVNRGEISGRMGRIVIAGQESFSVDVSGDGLYEIDLADAARTKGARAENSGVLLTEGGTVVISASAVRDAVEAAVDVGGVVAARSVEKRGGTITLSGGEGAVRVTGRLDASGAGGGAVRIDGGDVHLAGTARIDVSGAGGGGAARVDGGRIVTDAGARLSADATLKGDGGSVILFAEETQGFYGAVSARGGPEGGDGGFAEISADWLDFDGAADLSAPAGSVGGLLFDPLHLVIGASGPDDGRLTGGIGHDEAPGETLRISADALSRATADATLQAVNDIRVEADVHNRNPNADMTLEAGRHIDLSADLRIAGSLTLSAGAEFDGTPNDGGGLIRFRTGATVEGGGGLGLSVGASGFMLGPEAGEGTLISGGALALPRTASNGALRIEAAGPITQTGAMFMRGPLTVVADDAAVTLDDPGNRFMAAATLDAGDGAARLYAGGALSLGDLSAGELTLGAAQGVSADGAVRVAGDASIDGGAGDVTLADPANGFGGALRLRTDGDATLRASGDLRLGSVAAASLDAAAQGALRGTAGETLEIAGASRLSATGDIALGGARHGFGGTVTATGADVTLAARDAMSVELSASGTASLGAPTSVSSAT